MNERAVQVLRWALASVPRRPFASGKWPSERIGPTNAAILLTLEPVVTVVLAAIVFRETLKPLTLLGGGLILMAVLLLAQSELHRREPVVADD